MQKVTLLLLAFSLVFLSCGETAPHTDAKLEALVKSFTQDGTNISINYTIENTSYVTAEEHAIWFHPYSGTNIVVEKKFIGGKVEAYKEASFQAEITIPNETIHFILVHKVTDNK